MAKVTFGSDGVRSFVVRAVTPRPCAAKCLFIARHDRRTPLLQRTTEGTAMAEQAQEQVKEKAQEATEKARTTLREQVDSRSTQAGDQISQQAGDLRSLSHELRNQGKDGPARLAEQAADRAEKVGGYLSQSDADRILRDAEEFGRSNPWAVIAGGLAAGFLASRFLKASSSDRYHGRTQLPPPSQQDRFIREPHVGGAPATGPATTPAI
jgi:ElaB/YqjD/DUF883 family membrane-anchored ribosome-binding protein